MLGCPVIETVTVDSLKITSNIAVSFLCLAGTIGRFVSLVWQYMIVRYFKEMDIYMNLNFCY